MLIPPCEYEIAGDLGNLNDLDNVKYVNLTAKFQKPCSNSNILSQRFNIDRLPNSSAFIIDKGTNHI